MVSLDIIHIPQNFDIFFVYLSIIIVTLGYCLNAAASAWLHLKVFNAIQV